LKEKNSMNNNTTSRVRSITLAVSLFATLLVACTEYQSANLLVGALKLKPYLASYTTMTEEQRVAGFKQLTGENWELRAGAVGMPYGTDLVYLSPEQETALWGDHTSFVWGVVSVALQDPRLAEMLGLGADPFFQIVKEYGTTVVPSIKTHSDTMVDQRIAALKQRLGTDMFAHFEPRELRDLIWDDKRFQSVMTDNQAAYDAVHQAWLTGYEDGYSASGVTLSDIDQTGLQNWFNGLTVPGGQPPS
jgi:hypothetical protein